MKKDPRNPWFPQPATCSFATWKQLILFFRSFGQSAKFDSLDSSSLWRSSGSATPGSGGVRRSFAPGFDEALPYQIIPMIAIIIPRTTCILRPAFPKKVNPRINTRIVFMWPRTWKVTAENLPIQMNWLRLVPIAITQERRIRNCKDSNASLVNKISAHLSYSYSPFFTSITDAGR